MCCDSCALAPAPLSLPVLAAPGIGLRSRLSRFDSSQGDSALPHWPRARSSERARHSTSPTLGKENASWFKRLFAFAARRPPSNTNNEAGGRAYAFSPEHALAQYAVTGTMHNTFYATAEQQLETILALAAKVPPEFVAKTARLLPRARLHEGRAGAARRLPRQAATSP